ncbi:MAG: DHHA1 domain-containing protein [Geminicoccaceae bacterium]
MTTESFGFAYGPRINAAGRLDHALISAKLLMTDDEEEAEALAQQLEALNLERRRLEREATTQAERALKDQIGAVALGVHPDWHPGVLGIVAGRLVERLHKPVLLAGQEEDLVKGSGRSVPGFDLGGALVDAQRKGLALKAGGHPMAGGFTVRSDHLDAFRAHLETWPAGAPEPPSLALDGTLMVAGASLNLALSLEKLAPFGQDHQVPRFRIRDASVVHVQEVGKQHLRCQVRGPDGSRLEAIAFRCLGTELGRALQDWRGGPPCQLAGKLSVDRYRGFERAHFMIEDLATAEA